MEYKKVIASLSLWTTVALNVSGNIHAGTVINNVDLTNNQSTIQQQINKDINQKNESRNANYLMADKSVVQKEKELEKSKKTKQDSKADNKTDSKVETPKTNTHAKQGSTKASTSKQTVKPGKPTKPATPKTSKPKTSKSKPVTPPNQKIFNPDLSGVDFSVLTEDDMDCIRFEKGSLTVEQAAELGKVPVEEIENYLKIVALINKEVSQAHFVGVKFISSGGKLSLPLSVACASLVYDEDDNYYDFTTRTWWDMGRSDRYNSLFAYFYKQSTYLQLHQFGFTREQCEEIYVMSMSACKYRSKFYKTYNLNGYKAELKWHLEGIQMEIRKK